MGEYATVDVAIPVEHLERLRCGAVWFRCSPEKLIESLVISRIPTINITALPVTPEVVRAAFQRMDRMTR